MYISKDIFTLLIPTRVTCFWTTFIHFFVLTTNLHMTSQGWTPTPFVFTITRFTYNLETLANLLVILYLTVITPVSFSNIHYHS